MTISCPFAAKSGHRSMVDSHPSLGFLPDEVKGAVWNCFTCGQAGVFHDFLDKLEIDLSLVTEKALRLLEAALLKNPLEYSPRSPSLGAPAIALSVRSHA